MLTTRRALLAVAGLFALTPQILTGNPRQPASAPDPEPFDPAKLRERARALAAVPYQAPTVQVPESLAALNYDQYRDIRFRPESALWGGTAANSELQFFHLGFLYRAPVYINVVEEGISRRVLFDPTHFDYGPLVPNPPTAVEDLGFSGFRVHTAINRPDYRDEYLVFQGASYFRAVAQGQVYGLSARGLAVATADPGGEEFPDFREFWIEKPVGSDAPMVIHALLDSPSVSGIFRFVARPGMPTTMEVEASLFPRRALHDVGIAPLTSMFYFAAHDRVGVDDFRGAVHDSDGLAVLNGQGEWIWRPLLNPRRLESSSFLDNNPRGFGLMQRERDFNVYQDLEADYELRPSLWVEPMDSWGPGSVMLIEIPADAEIYDNIVAFWRPAEPLAAGAEHTLRYRLHWGNGPSTTRGVAQVRRTMVGFSEVGRPSPERRKRSFIIDFSGSALDGDLASLQVEASASAGVLSDPVIKPERPGGMVRVALELDPQGERLSELRCRIKRGDQVVSETWVFRWLA